MNIPILSLRTVAAALVIGVAGCASQPPPRSQTSYTPVSTPRPQPSGYVSVRYVQPTPTDTLSAAAERTRQQVHMMRALTCLMEARSNLEASSSTRSGQREIAIRHTNQAIGHVAAGLGLPTFR